MVELNIRPPRALCRPQEGERRTPVVVQHDPIHDCTTTTGIAVLPADNGEQRFAVGLLDGLGVKEDGVPGHRFQHCSALDTAQHDILQSLKSVEDGFGSHANVRPRVRYLAECGITLLRSTSSRTAVAGAPPSVVPEWRRGTGRMPSVVGAPTLGSN